MLQTKCSEIYYNTCAAIYQHNCYRQDNLHKQQKLQTKTGDKRIATSIFGIYCVDAWLMYRGYTADLLHIKPQPN